MIKTIELRQQPNLKFLFSKDDFKIIDTSEPKNNGVYKFTQLTEVTLKKEKTDWWITSLSWLLDIFSGSTVAGNFKNKAHLTLKMKNQILKIWLIDADLKKAQEVVDLLNKETIT
jgi:hypothetical protein